MRTTSTWFTLLLILGAAAAFSLLQSCEELQEATTFKIKYDLPDAHYSIDSVALFKTELELFSQSFSIPIDSIADSSGLVESVSFYKIKLNIVSPETASFNWLSSARITLTPEGSGLPLGIGNIDAIDPESRSLNFLVKDVDILSASKKPFIVSVYGNLNGNIPTLPMEVLMESGIELTISPFH